MQLSRSLAAAWAAFALAATAAMPEHAHARDIVGFPAAYAPGTVVVKTSERSLYYVLGYGRAVRYPVGVGRAGKQWSGTAIISGKFLRPAWTPPAEVRHDRPDLPNVIPGGTGPVTGSVIRHWQTGRAHPTLCRDKDRRALGMS